MLNQNQIIKLLYIAYIMLSIHSYTGWTTWNPLASTLTFKFIQIIFIFTLLLYPTFKYNHIWKNCRLKSIKIFNIFTIYTIILSIYSLLVNTSKIENVDFALFWMYIQAMLTCIMVYTLINPRWFYISFRIIFKITPWILIGLMPIAKEDYWGGVFGFIFRPLMFILIFISVLNIKNKIFYICLSIITILLSYFYDARSNLIIVIVCLLIGLTINTKIYRSYFKHTVWIFILTPFILFYTGITGIFNIFETDKYLKNSTIKKESLTDTRTLVYFEALNSAVNNNYVIFGRGIGRGYQSAYQEAKTQDIKTASARIANERQSEVGILNIFTWGGIIYIIIFSLMYFNAIYIGVYKSKNKYIRATSYYLVFYYLYSWIENFQSFSITFISSWFIIALCISPYFRNMSNQEFEYYINRLTK